LRNPVVASALSEVGFLRWSTIILPDPFDILGQARALGLAYGATVSTGLVDALRLITKGYRYAYAADSLQI